MGACLVFCRVAAGKNNYLGLRLHSLTCLIDLMLCPAFLMNFIGVNYIHPPPSSLTPASSHPS